MSEAEKKARERLANNGRNPANNNAGIQVGDDLHLCEMLLSEIERMQAALKPFADIALMRDTYPDAEHDCIDGPDLSVTPKMVRGARAALGQGGEKEK